MHYIRSPGTSTDGSLGASEATDSPRRPRALEPHSLTCLARLLSPGSVLVAAAMRPRVYIPSAGSDEQRGAAMARAAEQLLDLQHADVTMAEPALTQGRASLAEEPAAIRSVLAAVNRLVVHRSERGTPGGRHTLRAEMCSQVTRSLQTALGITGTEAS